jgi:glutamine---fructose-6-phosphate transaminase (isomerizing)
MKHGPIALSGEAMPVVALALKDRVYEKMLSNIQEAKARGGSVIAVTTAGDDTLWRLLDGNTDSIVSVPAMSEELAPIGIAIPLQLLAYHIAIRRGCDVDQPRNLAKSVTVE